VAMQWKVYVGGQYSKKTFKFQKGGVG